MPLERIHQERKKKNFALFAALLFLAILFFVITLLKFPR
jgi:hypothetical protein